MSNGDSFDYNNQQVDASTRALLTSTSPGISSSSNFGSTIAYLTDIFTLMFFRNGKFFRLANQLSGLRYTTERGGAARSGKVPFHRFGE